ncbi:MAG: hypothetical protein IJ065_01540 [Eubacterium sp.]|nr:hypothetical protein [Eubacterium sp.]
MIKRTRNLWTKSPKVEKKGELYGENFRASVGYIDVDIDVERDIKIIKEFGTYILKTQ